MYDFLRFLHIITAVFMSVPLYNLIVVNERGRMGKDVPTDVDKYFENIIRGGASRCFVFQMTVFISGILLLAAGSMGMPAIWTDLIIGLKTFLLVALTFLLAQLISIFSRKSTAPSKTRPVRVCPMIFFR